MAKTTIEVDGEDVQTGNTYDKYASKNPVERKLMEGFFAALDAVAARHAARPHPRGRRGRGRGHGPPGRALPGCHVRAASTCPTPSWPATGTARALAGCSATSAGCRSPTTPFDLVLAIEVLEHVPVPGARPRRAEPGRPPGPGASPCPASRSGAPPTWLAASTSGPRQHARPHQPLGQEGVRRARRPPLRRPLGPQPLPVDDGGGQRPLLLTVGRSDHP